MTIWQPGSRAAAPPLMQRLACNLKDGCCGEERPDFAWRGCFRLRQFRSGPPPTLSSGSQALSCPISASSFSTLPRLIFTLAICSDQAVLNNSGATCRVCFCCSNATPRTLAPSNTRLTARNNEPAPLGKTHAFHSRPLKRHSSTISSWNVASLRDRSRDKARKICIC